MAIFFSPPLLFALGTAGLCHALRHRGPATRRELLHQLSHLLVLRQHLVDLLHTRSRARGDALPARAVDHGRLAALLRRHREDDRLYPVELALVDLRVAHLLADAGKHAEDRAHRAELADLLDLIEEIVERELVLADLPLELLALLLVELALGALDQREHVAHAEDARGHAVGMELLER